MQQDYAPGPAAGKGAPRSRPRYRSLFWAIVLIGVGAVWLLFTLDVIAPANLGMLTYVWPILLIGIGVDLLIGRRSLVVGALVGIITVGLIIVLMALGPAFGWTEDSDLQTQTFSTAVGEATSAQISLDTGGYSADIHALPSSTAADRALLEARVIYRGTLHFESTGGAEKAVLLEPEGRTRWWHFLELENLAPWEIGLDPSVPVRLSIESGSGSNEADLSALQLTDLEVDISSGSAHVILPSTAGHDYPVSLELSSGDMDVEAAGGSRIDMSIEMSSGDVRVTLDRDSDVAMGFEGSSGEFTLMLAPGQALRVEVRQVSSGDVKVPSGLVQIEKGDDEEGIWETEGYATASHKVVLVIEKMSSGSADIRFGG